MVILVLLFIAVIRQPLRIPAKPAGPFGSTNLTLRSPVALKKTENPKSPAAVVVLIELIPALSRSHSVFFIAKLHLSTGAVKPVSILKGWMAVMMAAGSAKLCTLKLPGI